MKLEKKIWSTEHEVRTTPLDEQGMKLEQHLLIHREWIQNNNYWSTGNEVRTTTIDQQGMKLEQHLLANSKWN